MRRAAALILSFVVALGGVALGGDEASGAPAKRKGTSSSGKAPASRAAPSTPSGAPSPKKAAARPPKKAGAPSPKKAGAPSPKKTAARSPEKSAARASRNAPSSAARSSRGSRGSRSSRSGNGASAAAAPPVSARAAALPILVRAIHCPEDMVAVAGRVCVDRFETTIVDARTGADWSPFYTPDLARARTVAEVYAELLGRAPPSSLGARMPLPPMGPWAEASIAAQAVSSGGVLPQGYLSGDQADAACRSAGKRLCSEAEWLTACRGQESRDFPYGDRYEHGVCNVYRESHPTALMHGNAARYHDDPRNGLVEVAGRTLLQPTGAAPRCASRWGDDAIFDMVGNLDEWVADPGGVFVGGFYSRGSRSGCFARVGNHTRSYSDYSTGTRCCADPGEVI